MSVPSRPADGVSICVSNWNHKGYLSRSIGSALAAAKCLERAGLGAQVLVIDDGSRDGSQRTLFTAAALREDRVLEVHLSPRNQGLPRTRNWAIRLARYRWVCILDADNEVVPENLVLLRQAAMETEATLAYGNLIAYEGDQPVEVMSSDVPHEGLLEVNYIDAFCMLDADKVVALGGYTTEGYASAHEDWDLMLHLVAEGQRVVFVPLVLGTYYREPSSMIKTTAFDHSRVHRVYNQRRAGMPLSFEGARVYYPGVGYLIR